MKLVSYNRYKRCVVAEVLEEKTNELKCMQEQCRIYEDTIKVMNKELDTTQQITKEVINRRLPILFRYLVILDYTSIRGHICSITNLILGT